MASDIQVLKYSQEKEQIFEDNQILLMCSSGNLHASRKKNCVGYYVITPRKFTVNDHKELELDDL